MARESSHPVHDSHGNRVKNLSYRETAQGRVYERWAYVGKGGRGVRRGIAEPGAIRSHAEAIRKLRALEVKDEATKLARGRRLESLKLEEAAARYFEATEAFIARIEVEGVPEGFKGVTSIDTLKTYRTNYNNRIKPFFRRGILCSDITTLACQDFLRWLRTQPGRTGETLAEGTVNSVKSTLSAILEEARVAGGMDTDPLAGLPKRDRPTTTPRGSYRKIALRPEVLFAIFDNSPNDYRRAIVGFALFAGMRAGEIMALKWEDIRFDDEAPHVWIAHSITKARERKATTKTGKERPFPLNAEMIETLQTHRVKERARGLGADTDYVFSHPRRAEFHGRPMSVMVVSRSLAEACKGLALVDGKGEPIEAIDGRAARRSVATLLANNPSIPRHISAGQMGHSVETAERRYVQKHHDAQEIEMVGLAIKRPTLTVIEGGKEKAA